MNRAEARALGLKRYTSSVCLNGHLSERLVSDGQCCECKRQGKRGVKMAGFWTEERIEQLKAAITRGDSYSTIAEALHITRSGVGGKVHRLGLSVKAKSRRPSEPRPRRVTRVKPHLAPVRQSKAPYVSRPYPSVKTCQWPNCEKPTARGSYCLSHGDIVYVAPRHAS